MLNIKNDSFIDWQHWLTCKRVRGLILSVESDNFNLDFHKSLTSQQKDVFDSKQLGHRPSDKVDHFLGNEFSAIFFDASQSFDCNSFVALAGTLLAGGYYVIQLPQALTDFLTPSAIALQSKQRTSIIDSLPLSQCLKRIIRFSIDSPNTVIVNKNQIFAPKITDNLPVKKSNFQIQQEKVVEQICRVALGHAKRPLVIIANRGRGKSAALGIAAARLLTNCAKKIIVTAPHRNNVDSLYKHLNLSDHTKHKFQLDNGGSMAFVAVDQLIENIPQADLLMVDEAAAIPVQLLQKIIQHYNRIVFSSTSDGYEGNGKGFEIRFQQQLINKMPQTRFATLSEPIRWSSEDQLESIINKSFLLTNPLPHIEKVPEKDSVKFVVWDKAQLIHDEERLQQIFSLLVNAHYQTRPADLEQLLTRPELSVASLIVNDIIIAVALLNKEGQLEAEECQQINLSKKRLKGELLPQSIIIHSGIEAIGKYSFLRVMRIAVLPQLQQQKFGTQLLNCIETFANNNLIDFIGASFSAEPDVVNFWMRNHFQLIRIGNSKDSSSGQFSCEMLKPLNKEVVDIQRILSQRFSNGLLYKLKGELNAIDGELTVKLLCNTLNPPLISPTELLQIQAFASGAKGLTSVDFLLAKWLSYQLGEAELIKIIGINHCSFLIDLLLKQLPFELIAKNYQLTGKKQIINHLRALLLKIL